MQLHLPPSGGTAAPSGERVVLEDAARSCRVVHIAGWLLRADADRLFEELSRDAPWDVEAPLMFGKRVAVRRRSCSYGDPGTTYRYSGLERRAVPWPAPVRALVERLERERLVRFNYALCNLYPDGAAGLGWHSDDESDLAPNAPIGSVSLGEERDFCLRPKGGGERTTVALRHGDLLVMEGATQRHYQHAVPPRKRTSSPRINLTFRSIVSSTLADDLPDPGRTDDPPRALSGRDDRGQ